MSKKNINTNETSRRYAKALFSLSKNQSDLDKNLSSLQNLVELKRNNEDFYNFIKNPLVSSEKKVLILEKIFKKIVIEKKFSSFLKVLARHNRLNLLDTIFNTFKTMIEDKNNETNVKIISTAPLTEDLKIRLIKKLQSITGKKINLINLVDKKILGGMIIKINSLMVDHSIKTKLERYQFSVKGIS